MLPLNGRNQDEHYLYAPGRLHESDEQGGDVLLIGSSSDLQAYHVEDNRDLFVQNV